MTQEAMDLHMQGERLREKEQWLDASEFYRQAIALYPKFSWSHNGLGECLLRMGFWKEASLCLRTATELNPRFVWSYCNLGDALAAQKSWEAAIFAYEQAIHLDPDLKDKISQKLADARWQRSLEDAGLAWESYQRSMLCDPDNIQAYYRAIEVQPQNPILHIKLGDALVKVGKSHLALASYRIALQIQSDNSEIQEKIVQLVQSK